MDTTFLPPEKRDFGIVFQSYALFPNLTVEENIAIGLKNQGMSTKEALESGRVLVRNHWFTNIWPEIPESIVRWTTATCGARSRIGSFSRLGCY